MTPATILQPALLFHLFRPHPSYTVVLDDQPVGKIEYEEERVLTVGPGEHRLHLRFVGLRRSEELRMSLAEGEERQLICGTSGMGWPTLREASPEEAAQIKGSSLSEPPEPGNSDPQN